MCGIVGYVGNKDSLSIIIKGLKRLEYRGYDSSGVAISDGNTARFCKSKGKKIKDISGPIGIGHTRWATHGEPSDINAHPHISNSGKLLLVHNGIIENYNTLKEKLINEGFSFVSETDTEVLVNLIEFVKQSEKLKLGEAVQIALRQVIGAYAICVMDYDRPNELVVAKLGSPLCIGMGKNEFYIAPMYNLMIRDGLKITAANTEKMHVLGAPHQFEFFVKRVITRFGDKPIALASDHSGFDIKKQCKDILDTMALPYIDVGTFTNKSCDYPDYVLQVTKLIQTNECSHGISFCRSGQGANITANKVKGIISALCFDEYMAQHAIKHNCANHFSIPSKYVDKAKLESILKIMLNTSFDGGRHFNRLFKLL